MQAEGYGVEAGSAADSDHRQVAALIRVRDPVGLVVVAVWESISLKSAGPGYHSDATST